MASLDGSVPPRTLFSGVGAVNRPLWSPDGSQIVFESDRNGSWDVWVVDVAAGTPKPIETWGSKEDNAVWSPDGASILFLSDSAARLGDLWRVAASGGEPTRLTTEGTVGPFATWPGVEDVLVGTIGRRGGQLALSRVAADGSVHAVWDKSNVAGFGFPRPSGDSVVAQVQQADGSLRPMLLAMNGSGGRVILGPGEVAGLWSPDGKSILYYLTAAGATDAAILDVATGKTERLTTTPQSEVGGEFTTDGKQVVFQRLSITQRLQKVDLTRLMEAPKQP